MPGVPEILKLFKIFKFFIYFFVVTLFGMNVFKNFYVVHVKFL